MKNSRYILFALFVSMLMSITAQLDPTYRQYRFNALLINPAQAGANDFDDVSVLGTQYWVNMPGAPRTLTLSGNMRPMDNVGIGATIVADENGPVTTSSANLLGAYHLKLSDAWKLSLGLKASAINHSVMLSQLKTTQQNDPDMQNDLATGLSFNAGYGFLAYTDRFYVGFSQQRVAAYRFQSVDMASYIDQRSGYISYAGYDFDVSERLSFRPSVLTIFGHGGPLFLDANANFTFDEIFDFGVSYQLNGSLGSIFGITIKERLKIGYAYSYPVNRLNTVSIQSHEVALRLILNKKKLKTAESPRFFN